MENDETEIHPAQVGMPPEAKAAADKAWAATYWAITAERIRAEHAEYKLALEKASAQFWRWMFMGSWGTYVCIEILQQLAGAK